MSSFGLPWEVVVVTPVVLHFVVVLGFAAITYLVHAASPSPKNG